jgi:hypothetical protein
MLMPFEDFVINCSCFQNCHADYVLYCPIGVGTLEDP